MPKTNASGDAKKSELPDTLKRSDEKAQRTFSKAYDSAMDQYGDEERAHRTAYDALKQTHEKVGDQWEPKSGSSGPSDEQSEGGQDTNRETAGGVDANATKEHLYDQAQELEIEGRSKMTKDELVDALEKESKRRTSKNS
ncbi:ChaB family protein [Yaniella flava]|uniref:ChaB family protein n=1 Tax=Yaniella flava TaxID=287930 RepID=A0ABN2UZ31_9MICC|nr:ChaB family protein [Micrococcaceae bacterium]